MIGPVYQCKCGWSSFSISFEYVEPITIGRTVILKCLNKRCGLIHRIVTGSEWPRDFLQDSFQAEEHFKRHRCSDQSKR